MVRSKREPTESDGPFVRAAYHGADDVDKAETPEARRKAWTRVVSAGVAALAETFLRDTAIWGAVVFSVVVAVLGVTSGTLVWAVGCLISGVAGIALVLVAVRRWSLGRQWSVYLGVILVQIVLMVALWQGQ